MAESPGVVGTGSRELLARTAALLVAISLVVASCGADQGKPTADADTTSLAMPLPTVDAIAALRDADAELRRAARERSGLAKLGPGALELAGLMDRTASFLLAQLPAQLGTLRAAVAGGGRLAAPRRDLPAPGVPLFSAYVMTSVVFTDLIGRGQDTTSEAQAAAGEKCPCTKTGSLGDTVDEVTVAGNKGTITTSTTATATVNGSKVSLDIKIKVSGEVRDAVSAAVLYKVNNEASGHAEGDACPDPSGTARARMTFDGHEDQFDGSGAKVGSRAIEHLSGDIGARADDNAKLAGVDLKTSGQGAPLLMKWAATSVAPAMEKAWRRNGTCIEVLVDPDGKDVDKDSETTVTVKLRHKVEGNALDKGVEAKLTSGVKTIEPSGSKQKAPATFKYRAGAEDGDRGGVLFESISNRGIGSKGVGFLVAGGWTISSVGTSKEDFQGVISNSFSASIKDLKITAGKDGALTGTGSMRLNGSVSTGAGICTGEIDQTLPVTASGTLVGTGPGAVLRLKLHTPAVPGVTVNMVCRGFGTGQAATLGAEGHADRYGEALGQFELPADGGSKAVSKTTAIGGAITVAVAQTFTVVRPKR